MQNAAESDAGTSKDAFSEGLSKSGISYRIYGQRSNRAPLVMVMGYGGCMFSWPLSFVQKLAERQKVIIFDNRGTGRSAPLLKEPPLRMPHMAEDLRELLDSLEIAKVNVLGYSMGGCISLEFSRLYPQRLEKLILQSSTAGGKFYVGADNDVKERMANPRGSNFDEMLFDFFDLCMSVTAMEAHLSTLKAICENARPYPTPPRVLLPQLEAFRNFDASSFVADINTSVLLIHGEGDRILKAANGKKLADALPNCQAVYFESCGHCPHIEHEDAVLSHIEEFLC